ncbi:putative lytic murein transglycosylase [Bacillus phage vB_BspM_AgentSmith]|nr:putative lytic murein transglycosylase [Bacillus phage vB_BspM_AgentSmith]
MPISLAQWDNHTIRALKRYALMFVFMMCVPLSAYSNGYIPPQAFDFKLNIQEELDKHFDYIPDYNYVPALIEHESCLSLSHSRCWNSTSRLKTQREEGAGLGIMENNNWGL